MHTKEYAKQLADSKEKNAEQAAEINALKQQMQQLTTMLAEQNVQGAPTLVETELPTPKIRVVVWLGREHRQHKTPIPRGHSGMGQPET